MHFDEFKDNLGRRLEQLSEQRRDDAPYVFEEILLLRRRQAKKRHLREDGVPATSMNIADDLAL